MILIRHGQYNLDGKTDEERYLTKLGKILVKEKKNLFKKCTINLKGRQQAEYTGRRLQDLGLPYIGIIKSTMTRAQETGSIISQYLPQVRSV